MSIWAKILTMSIWAKISGQSRRAGACGERGAAAVEFLLIAPVLFMTCLLLIQWAVRLEAERAVDAAAREGAVAAASWDGDESAGRQTALDYLHSLDPRLSNRSATAVRGAEESRVTVEGDVLSFLPLLDLHVSATATVPTERFVETSGEFTNSEGSGGGN
jgi:Flp pilus assembly protein TadG